MSISISSDDDGFTLLEVMIVLGLMAMGVMLIGPMLHQGSSARDLDQLAGRIAADLRLARVRSMRTNTETALAFDPASRTFMVMPGQDHVALPADVSADLKTGREVQDGSLATIRFLPDGRSSGGDIHLTAGSASTRLTVDWLTGWVRQVSSGHVLSEQVSSEP